MRAGLNVLKDVSLSTVKAFESAARHRSFRAAASELNLSPSATCWEPPSSNERVDFALAQFNCDAPQSFSATLSAAGHARRTGRRYGAATNLAGLCDGSVTAPVPVLFCALRPSRRAQSDCFSFVLPDGAA